MALFKKGGLKRILLLKLALPFVAFILLAALVLTIFDIDIDSRGPQQTIFLDSDYENPTEYSEGSYHALALVEPEALADAYYKYMSVNSHTKIVDPGAADEVTLEFSDERKTTDFATLMDYYKRENYYFLSSYYIKMVDEMYHKNAFFYPEQFIKPVYYEVTQGIGSDGSPAPRLQAKPIAKLNEDSNELVLLAESKTWQDTTPDEADVLYEKQSETDSEPGVWDYGFGSVIQYGDYKKDVYIKCKYDSFQIHRHLHYWESYTIYDDETGDPTGTGYSEVEVCAGVINIPVAADSTVMTLREKILSYNEPETPEGGGSWYTVEWSPSDDQLALFLNTEHNDHIMQKITVDDEPLARRKFNNGVLDARFGNNRNLRDEVTDDDYYPITISLIDSVATMSGTVSYQYDVDAYTTRGLTSQASANDEDPYMYMIQGECCGGTMTAKRSGDVVTVLPIPSENVEAYGFDYIDGYAAYYQPYVPQEVTRSIDFSDRIDTKTEEGKKTLSLMISLGLLKPYGADPAEADSTSAEMTSYSDYELLGRMLAVRGFDSQEDELYFAAMTANRLHNSDYPNTLEEIFEADPETYAGYSDESFSEASPSARDLQAATLALRGQFPIPDNVLYLYSSPTSIPKDYSAFSSISAEGNTHYYCYNGNLSKYCWSTIRDTRKTASTASELASYVSSFASNSEGSITGVGASEATTDFSKYRSYCDQADVERIARMVWGESRGVSSTSEASVLTQQAAVIWTVLNRVDHGYGSISQIVVPSIYNGYDPNTPLSTVGSTIINLVYDVMCRWYAEKDGVSVNGRVLPADYIYFYGDGKNNHFYNDYACLTYLQRQSRNGTLSSGIASLRAQRKEWLFSTSSPYDDVAGMSLGYASGGGTTLLGFSSKTSEYRELDSEYPLYIVESFDVIAALSSMQGLADDSENWLVSVLKESFFSVSDAVSRFFTDLTSPFYDPGALDSPVLKVDVHVDQVYARDPVYQAIAFSTSTNYSGVISSVNQMMSSDGAMLLFVGKETGVGIGTASASVISYIPGTGVTIERFKSPTSSYYKATSTFSSRDPAVTIAAPSSTPIKAVSSGTILELGEDYVIIEHKANDSVYQIRYGNLSSVCVSSSVTSVMSSQIVGYAGDAGYSLQVLVDGILTNPLSIFYQPVYSTGVPFADLLGSDGNIDDAKVENLRNLLAATNNKSKGVYDRWHQRPINMGITWECAWYAYGRGLQYLESQGYPIATLPKAFGNGGDYYSNGSPYFVCNQTPSANSWIVWSPDPGSQYGHVAYVEAVSKTGDLLISESGSTFNAPGLRWLKAGTYGTYKSVRYGTYHLAGFVHLDQPR